MSDNRPSSGDTEASDPAPRVQDLTAGLLAAAGARVPESRGGTVLAMAEAADPLDPLRVEPAGGGCGGGRRVVLDGDAVALTDGGRPTHLLARAVGPDGAHLLVMVERGERGVDPWPPEGAISTEVAFRSVRLPASGVVSGVVDSGG